MARVSSSFNISGGYTGYIIFVLTKTTAPVAELDRIVWNSAVDPNPVNYSFTDLEDGTYIVTAYESGDGVTLGNIRHSFWQDAATNVILFERRFYQANGPGDHDPVADGVNATITDPYFEGKTVSGVFKEQFRYLRPVVEFEQVGDAVNMLSPGAPEDNPFIFADGEVWAVEITYLTMEAPSTAIDPFSRIVLVGNDLTLDSTFLNKTIVCVALANTQLIELPTLGTIPDEAGYHFINEGDAVNVQIKLFGAQTVRFAGADVNSVYLGTGESARIIKKDGGAFVVFKDGAWRDVGKVQGVYAVGLNQLPADRATEYDGNVYKRIYDYIVNKVPAAGKVALADYALAANLGKWAVDTGTKKFRTPDFRGRVLKHKLDADAVGRVEAANPGSHSHDFKNYYMFENAGSVVPAVNKITIPAGYNGGIGNQGTDTDNNTFLYRGDTTDAAGTGETTVSNIGLIGVICI